ncbi:flagellar hook-associated protein FlgL [Luteimonas yindakuii]|uniref:flagellar hook-associated protein FlgL n=1 Tax=Luteimonas yindakuii TaxID=2565782 RepID=UPI0011076850|nr:flagellar hook-associated protein FlgL [Luteimonas yindakuii]QCU72562.1 flagellar hook-associated protein FlgL [Luteimonas yindakuii]
MSNRISTGMLYQQSISTLQSKQAQLAKLQQQLATGQKLITAKDDPVGAGAAVGMDRALAALERFEANGNTVRHRLGMQESVLTQAGGMMGRINELTVQANGGALSDGDRKAIAIEVTSLRDGLLDLANSTDGTGRYLFGGTQDGSAPFARTGTGVIYGGDQTQRQVEIAPQMFVADALPGSEVFLRVRAGDGRIDAAAAAGNTGTGQIGSFGLVDSAQWDGGRYSIAFGADASYTVTDAGGTEVATGVHVPGEAITFAGAQIVLRGAPADGDSFEVSAAGTRDIFATVDRLLGALQMSATTDTQRAAQQNALQSSMRDIATAQEHMIDARASGGAQLSALDNAASLRDAQGLTLETTLSGLRDLDYADAIARFDLEKVALEAAQLSFVQMQRLSLFNLIR